MHPQKPQTMKQSAKNKTITVVKCGLHNMIRTETIENGVCKIDIEIDDFNNIINRPSRKRVNTVF